ncbi:MAG TPA: patatin-like phospholipase family protein [Nitrospiria bacterium]
MRRKIARHLERLQDWIRRFGRPPRLGLSLGSGAALGVAHIGVLSVFYEMNIPISFLSGSSAGSIVGALYAGGIEGPELEACGRDYRWRDAGRLNYFPKMGLARNHRVVDYLRERIGDARFEDLRIPFFVTATHLASGTLKIFSTGPVIPAVRASCAIPGIFSPVEIDGELYCDGGVLRKNPCGVLREAGADQVICSMVDNSEARAQPTNIFEVIRRALDIAMQDQVQQSTEKADIIIRPDLRDLKEFDFDQNDVLIERGKKEARKILASWPVLEMALPRTKPIKGPA